MFVTSDGSPYPRFQRALKTGNLTLVMAAAAELPRVGLQDAIEVCLLLRDEAGDRFERAAVRWLGRFALEARSVTIDAIQTAAAALSAMPYQPERAMPEASEHSKTPRCPSPPPRDAWCCIFRVRAFSTAATPRPR